MKTLLRTLALALIVALALGAMLSATGCAKKETPAPAAPVETPTVPAEEPVTAEQGEAILIGSCTDCHDADRIYLQPEGTDWKVVIDKMESAHGAEISDGEKAALISFLENRSKTEAEATISGKCTECHDVSRLYQQPDGTSWEGVLKKMMDVHGAVLTEAEQAAVITYLEGN